MVSTNDLESGAVFAGKYRIERELGQGGMSTVYEATNVALQSRVALKILSEELTSNADAAERFVREGIAASRVRHRAVVQIFDAGEHEGKPWMAMELLEGEALSDLFQRVGVVEAAEMVRIAIEVASGLGAAHELGVVHRDLKPHNIFLDASFDPPQPKILDFGIAKLNDSDLAKLTQTGLLLGTPHYMSPEQAQGIVDVTPAVDFWALGVILFEGLSGQMPYDAQSVAGYLGALVAHQPRPVRQVVRGAPESLLALIEACLQKDPERRPPDARTLVESLQKIAEELRARPTPTGVAPTLSVSPAASPSAPPRGMATAPGAPIPDPAAPAPRVTSAAATAPARLTPTTPPSRTSTAAGFSDDYDPARLDVPHRVGTHSVEGGLTGEPGVLPAAPMSSTDAQPSPSGPPAAPRPTIPSTAELPRRRRWPWLVLFGLVAFGLGLTCVIGGTAAIRRLSEETTTASRDRADATAPAKIPSLPTKLPVMPPPPTPTKAPPTQPPPVTPEAPAAAKTVLVDSVPRGAEIRLNGIPIGKRTPDTLELSSKIRIEVYYDGFAPGEHEYQPGQQRVFFRLQKLRRSKGGPAKSGGVTKGAEKIRVHQLPDWAKKIQKNLGRGGKRQ